VVQSPGTVTWLEDESGRTWPIEGDRRFRQDVHDAFGSEFGQACREAGFVVRLSGLRPGSPLRLMAAADTGVHRLSGIACAPLPVDPVAAARWLFGVVTPMADMHRRVPLVDEPVLGPLIAHRQTVWDELPVLSHQLGMPPMQPQVAVIVPLYGRNDFVEHQMIEFADDPWLRANAEIVYVLDDPKLVDLFHVQAESLYRIYRVPFRWVWGRVNRGFSGANNLGVAHSQAPTLVFLNSDAIPQRPGWAQALTAVLDARPEVGAVGPRLVFADGGIQHAGMEFQRREEFGIWVNHHPRMGLDPVLDPHIRLTSVPAVTGACLAVRRTDLACVGGWDTGYLVGDFEDSDLCLKLREAGLQIAYLPDVQLTHLERQSFKLLGHDEFRQRVVIYNAVRHQSRWKTLIEAGCPEGAVLQP
jgi:GT2 family glycosyltransferase